VESLLGSQVTHSLWDEASQYGDVILETDGDGDVLVSYVLGGMNLLSQTHAGETSYFSRDALGSTRALTDASGTVTDTYSYTAFGELFAQSGSTTNSYLFTGQQLDAATGLYSMRARYYDPSVGRFLTRDTYPVNYNDPVDLNRYVYVANDPINAIDPSGHSIVEFVGNLRASVKQTLAGASLGPATQLAYARLILQMYKLAPLLSGTVCLVASFATEADLSQACDTPIDDLVQGVARGIKLFFRAQPGGGSPFEAATQLIRQLASMSDTPGAGGKNLGALVISINDGVERWIWAVSGSPNGREVQRIEGVIENLTQVGGQVDDIAREGAIRILQRASDHAEAKLLEHTLINYINESLPPDSIIRVTLYIELEPCIGCGGGTGLGGNIQTFANQVLQQGHRLLINVVHSHPYG
jgi:RHS repeat-associated protein